MDKLSLTRKDATKADLLRMNRLAAAIYMTSQGIPFIHAGEEFLREKLDQNGNRVENSYNAPDFVNKIRWDVMEEDDCVEMIEYYRGLIAFRKAHGALRLTTAEEVAANVTYKWITNEVIMFEIDGKESVETEDAEKILVIFNATAKNREIDLEAAGVAEGSWNVCIDDQSAGVETLRVISESVIEIAPISALVLVK